MVSLTKALKGALDDVGNPEPKISGVMDDGDVIKHVGDSIVIRQPTHEEANEILKAYPGHNLFGRLSGKISGKPSPTKGVPFHDINMERIFGSDTVSDATIRGLIDGVVDSIKANLDHNVTRTFAEVQEKAAALGMDRTFEVLEKGASAATLKDLDVTLTAVGHAHVQWALAVRKSFGRYLNARANGRSQEEIDHLFSVASAGMAAQGVFVQNLINMRTATARALASTRQIAMANDQAAAPLLDLIQRGQRVGQDADPIAKDMLAQAYIRMPDPTQQSTFVKELASKGRLTADMIVEVFVNGLLASPVTHMVNTLSNALNGALAVPERAVAAVAGRGRTLIRSMPDDERVLFGEATSYGYALMSSFGEAFRAAGRSYMTELPTGGVSKLEYKTRAVTGENMARLIPGMDADGAAARGIDFMAKWFVRQPGRLLMAEDEFFKAIFRRAEMHALAYRRAAELVHGGMDTREAARIATDEIVVNPSQKVRQRMIEEGLQRTYQQDLEGGMARLAPFFQSAAMKPVTPFYKTPTNIAKAMIDRTPLPLLDILWGKTVGGGDSVIGKLGLSDFQKAVKEGGPAADMAMGKMAFGSMLLGSVYMLMESLENSGPVDKEGDIRVTGGMPVDKKTREAWQRAGIQPYSMHSRNADGSWTAVSFSRFEPVSGLLAIMADYRQLAKYEGEESLGAIMTAMTSGVYNYVGTLPMMQGIETLSNAVAFRPKGVGGLEALAGAFAKVYAGAALSTAQSAVTLGTMPPSLTKLIEGVADPQFRSHLPREHGNTLIMRNVWGAIQKWRDGIPGISQGLQPRLNRWAETVRGLDMPYLPTRIQRKDYSRVDLALVNLEGGVSMPQRRVEGIDLSAEQYNRWLEISMDPSVSDFHAGETPPTLLQQLDEAMFGEGAEIFDQWEDGEKVMHLQNIVARRDRAAKEYLYAEYPDLKEAIDAKKSERMQGGAGVGLDF